MIVDEAHATGVIGAEGRGLVHELGLQQRGHHVGTLGKALGSYGAFVCCDARTADFLVNRARTLIYSTALPPPSIGAALRALELMPALVAAAARERAVLRGALGVEVNDMPIVPLVFGAPEAALDAQRRRAGAGRLRPGDPPADGPGGHVAAAAGRHRGPRSRRPACAARFMRTL